MAKKSYLVKERLSHDGEDCMPGATIEMEEARAASLLKDGVVIAKAKATGKGGAGADDPDAGKGGGQE